MVDVTITGNDSVVFTFENGVVQGVKSRIASGIEITELPGSGPAAALGFDFSGTLKIITITGNIFAATSTRTSSGSTTTILEQKQWLEKQLNGIQEGRTFTSNYESQTFDGDNFVTTTILVGQVEFDDTVENPQRLPFVMNLLVAS